MTHWNPPAGTMTLVEPFDPEPGHEALTATVLDDDRLLLDLQGSPRPTKPIDVVATFFTPEAVYRVSGVLEPAGIEDGQFELIAKDVQRVQRRRSHRLTVELAATMVVADSLGPVVAVRGHTQNLSAGGCRIVTERALPPGAEPIVTLDLADLGPPVIAQATILRSEHHDAVWDYRLMFTSIDADDRTRLDTYCAA